MAGGEKRKPRIWFFKGLLDVISLYWKSDEKLFAWTGTLLLIILSLSGVATALITNEWFKYFYDSLQALDVGRFYFLTFIFLGMMVISVLRSVIASYFVDAFAIRWRKWLTGYYLTAWDSKVLDNKIKMRDIDNPDQRIAEDINKFTYDTLDLGFWMIYTITSAISFSVVLISVSGSLNVLGVTVPYYMFWLAVLYAIFGTYASQKIGFRLVGLSGNQQRMEGDLRYALVKFRDESALNSAQQLHPSKKVDIDKKLDISLGNMWKTIKIKAQLSLLTESYSQLSLIFSSLLAAPRFFSGKITFGELMQINSAFGNLQENLSWFINIYPRLADWKATGERLISLHMALATSSVQTEKKDISHVIQTISAHEPEITQLLQRPKT
ncbi:SbmA/BacA-like family transporter [Pseudomonas sp. HY7a-MNA-CIBAN-0227]|uniref:SbmA/BacA-like family transporter n=1 Tax=Pseudomonas sp. HY7a-MNA-CIBAN-0227 TaxID=3140474 RepID=UPI003320B059